MKRSRRFALCLALTFPAALFGAINAAEWKYTQNFIVDSAAPRKFALPTATHDTAQPDLRDLRILGADGADVPFALIRPAAESGQTLQPRSFRVELSQDTTVIHIESGTTEPLESVQLATGATGFIKAVRVETSDDGAQWSTLASGAPLFRRDGASETRLQLNRQPAAFIRLTLDDRRADPIVITNASLRTATVIPAPTEALPVSISRAEEFAGETVLTLDFGAANLPLASLEFEAEDPLFTRTVTAGIRELAGGEIVERTVGSGTLYRVALDNVAPVSRMGIVVNGSVPARQLIVHIANGDSPPLRITKVLAHRPSVYVAVAPRVAGQLQLLTGNPLAAAPRYDLSALSHVLNSLPLSTPTFEPIATRTDYRQADALANLDLIGASIDESRWRASRGVMVTKPGVQEIELDLAVLAGAQTSFGDLRLVRDGKQVPYIQERTRAARELLLAPDTQVDAAQPSLSRWRMKLPAAARPLTAISINSSNRLFERHFTVYEMVANSRGEEYRRSLASFSWTRKPDDELKPLRIALPTRLITDTLWIETDNGDNPAIAIDRVQAFYPVTRLLTRVSGNEPIKLLYGNDSATAPRYDVSLIATQLLASERNIASLAPAGDQAGRSNFLAGIRGGVIFWTVLAVVVVLLLFLVAKLLPKPPTQS